MRLTSIPQIIKYKHKTEMNDKSYKINSMTNSNSSTKFAVIVEMTTDQIKEKNK